MTEFARDDGSRNKLARAIKRLRGLGGDRPRGITLDRYVSEPPSAQNAIDCLPGWNTALRPEIGVVAGPATFYDDPRIHWALDQFGDVTGKSVLELGPLEASHTALIERRGAGSILAIEANRLAYLRCLVVKELLGLKASKFELGDFAPWLETTDRRFDLVVASGVLYHMARPAALLESLARVSDALFLWTQVADETAMPPGDPRRLAFVGEPEVAEVRGVRVRTWKRSYHGAWKSDAFCGGTHDLHRWIEREDLLALLRALGYADIRIAFDEPQHKFGPALSIFARKGP